MLAEADLVVISGPERGIDAAAHWGARDGGTIGVIAGGLDVVYPLERADLRHGSQRKASWSPNNRWEYNHRPATLRGASE